MAQFYLFGFSTYLHTYHLCTRFNSPLICQYLVWTSTSVWLRISKPQAYPTTLQQNSHLQWYVHMCHLANISANLWWDPSFHWGMAGARIGTTKSEVAQKIEQGAAITAVTRLLRVNNCHPVASKQRFLFTQHLAMKFTVTEHWGC